MSNYLHKNVTRNIPQTEQESPLQVPNSAGGFSFTVGPFDQLRRFLILGTQGGTYYVGEKDLTKQNLDNIKALIANDPNAVVDLTATISLAGRSYRNDAAILVLALVMTLGTDAAKSYARSKMNDIVRTSTHLFQYMSFLKALAPGTGLGTSRNRSIANWYESKSTEDLAYQAVKYRQREGWTHRDAFRQARPTGIDENLAKWILGKSDPERTSFLPEIVKGFTRMQNANDVRGVLEVLNDYPNLPWEALPTQFHKNSEVWKKLFYNGQLQGQALVRNITRLAKIGAFNDLIFAGDYATKLTDEKMIARTRLHPIQYLNALVVHTEGQVPRQFRDGYSYASKSKDWTTSPAIVDALNEGVHLSFKHIEPTGKRTLLAVDVSGSMAASVGMGLDLSAAQVSGVMASVIARTEPYYQIMGFASSFRDLGITAKMDLSSVMRRMQDNNFGSTDCSLPMTWALEKSMQFDTFVVITDNETWAGRVHPHVALKDYRRRMGIDARLIVVGVTATNFTIADPNDSGMLDVVGCDSNLPRLIAEFSKGNV
jgi:60 kDa SS-A/Ro ribonucleoprotein